MPITLTINSQTVQVAEAANFLTNSAYDPNSKIPEYKVCAVRVEAQDSAQASATPRRRQRRPPGNPS